MPSYDVVILGAGVGGYTAAVRAGQLGLKTAIVEKGDRMGGTCTLKGCIPTKALLESAAVYDLVRDGAGDHGIQVQGASFDWAGVQRRKDKIVGQSVKGIEFLMKKNGVEVLKGRGRLLGGGKIAVERGGETAEVEARDVILATGSYPKLLPGLPADGKRVVTSDEILGLAAPPRSLIVLGAGAVGVEFASIFKRFGAEVTVVEALDRIVPTEDEEVSAALAAAFRRRKIRCIVGARAGDFRVADNGVELVAASKEGAEKLAAEMLLVAVGRGPATDGLGLEKTRAVVERGYVKVGPTMETAEPHLYAIGDVVAIEGRPHPQLAHLAAHEGIVAAEAIAGKRPHPVNYDQVPGAIYCDPEVASVGLTERAARERRGEVRVGKFPFAASGKARILGETDGFVKIVADPKYGEVLGVHIIGPRATELIGEAVTAMKLETTAEEILAAIHPHPTLSEALGEAAWAAATGKNLNA